MTVLSILRSFESGLRLCPSLTRKTQSNLNVRQLTTSMALLGGHGPARMVITPSRYQWQKFKDVFHFYLLLGAIPCFAIIFYANVFIGPAKLAEIPPGYEPKHWEYYKHPISRFIARYITTDYQEDYERNLHYWMEESETIRMRKLEWKVDRLMRERGDYPNYYTAQIIAGKYIRQSKEETDEIYAARGDNHRE